MKRNINVFYIILFLALIWWSRYNYATVSWKTDRFGKKFNEIKSHEDYVKYIINYNHVFPSANLAFSITGFGMIFIAIIFTGILIHNRDTKVIDILPLLLPALYLLNFGLVYKTSNCTLARMCPAGESCYWSS